MKEEKTNIDEVQNNLLISINIDKEPYIKDITEDKIINLTGESGSGKSFFTNRYKDNDEYIIIDTDEVFARHEQSSGINKELGQYFKDKYQDNIPSLFYDFDKIYNEILNYFKDTDKIIVIDSAQYRNIKDISILKGKVIVMRTSINTCYDRCIKRFKSKNPNATKEELEKYSDKKRQIYSWYQSLNNFIERVDNL